MKFEPKEFGLQEKTDFLRDRAHLMNFEMNVPPIDEFDFRYQYRIYWVEKEDEFYDFDQNEQVKVKRETLSMRESGEEQFEDLEDDDVLAKVLMNNGKIVK